MPNCSAGCIAVGDSHDLKHGVSGTDDENPLGPVYPWPQRNGLTSRAGAAVGVSHAVAPGIAIGWRTELERHFEKECE